jgi:two-component system, cell cycle sensor histidine kinase and response regulator CckA
MNPAAVKILGKTHAEFLGSTSATQQHDTIREDGSPFPGLEHPSMLALATGTEVRNVPMGVYNPRERQYRWIDVTAVPLFRPGEAKPYQVYTVFEDFTGRKKAGEEIRQNQRTLSELIERAPFGVYIIDSGFRIAHMNAGSQNGAFRNVRPLIGRDFAEVMRILWPEPVAAEIIACFRHTLETGEPYHSPGFTNPRRDVTDVESYEWQLHRIALPGGGFGVVCYYFDSTALRQAEAEARSSEERLRLALSATNTAMWDWDLETGTIYWSPEHFTMLGYEPGSVEAGYVNWAARLHPEDRAETEAAVRNSVEQQRDYHHEFRVLLPDGSVHWLEARASNYLASPGSPRRMLGVMSDVTARKRAETELRSSQQRQAFLLKLSDALRPLDDPDDVRATAARMLGEHLGADWVAYHECPPGCAAGDCGVSPGYHAPGQPEKPGLPGRFRVADVHPSLAADLRAGRTGAIPDLAAGPRTEPDRIDSCDSAGVRSCMFASFAEERLWAALLVFQERPRNWTEAEIALAHEAVERIWPAVERARAAQEREAARAALAAQSRFVETTLSSIPDYVYACGRDRKFVYANRATQKLYGLNASEVKGKSLADVGCPPELAARINGQIDRIFQSGETIEDEAFFTSPAGVGAIYEFVMGPVAAGDGSVELVVGVSRDVTERRRLEQRLRESEERLRTVVENSRDGINLLDLATGRYVLMSPAQVELTGFTVEEINNIPAAEALERVHPEDREISLKQQELVAAGEELPAPAEYRWKVKSGEYRWFSDSRKLVRDAEGRPVALVGVSRDITDQKRAEHALREAQAILRGFFDSAPFLMGIAEFDGVRGVVISGNRAMAEFFGLEAADLSGKTARELGVPAEVEHAWTERYLECTLDAGPLQFECEYPCSTDPRWFRATVAHLGTGPAGNPRFSFVVEDITRRKRVENELRLSEERYRMMFDTMLEGFSIGEVVLDAEGRPADFRFLETNPAFETQSGLSNVRGRLMRELVPGHEPYWFERLGQVALTGRPERFLNEAKALNRWFDVSAYRIGGSGSRKVAFLFSDVTESRRAEERLRQAQKLESIGLLAGGIAHDFNNLLVGVIGNASLAEDILPPEHPAVEMVRKVVKTGEQLAHLTRQMLAYAGKGRFFLERLNLSAAIPEMVGLVQSSISKKVLLLLELNRDIPAIEADRGQMQQVLMNLVLNAAEAIGTQDGLVTVRTGLQAVDEAWNRRHPEAGDLRPGEYVCLEVQDNGCGMDESTRARIFDPFFSTKFIGRGLGLAAVSGIVRGHHGAIAVHTAPGEGSTFQVLFPAVAGPALKPAVESRAALRVSGVVLVVDDEHIVRQTARNALERSGCTVLAAYDGSAAIDVFKRYPGRIDLVVLDLSMPGMSGEETLPELRKIRPDVKVLVSSGYSEAEAMKLFHGQKVSGFVQKPYTASALADKVRLALG